MANLASGEKRKRQTEHAKALRIKLMDFLEVCRLSGYAEIRHHVLSRSWIAENIDCDVVTLSNSPILRRYIQRWETFNLGSLQRTIQREGKMESHPDTTLTNDSNVFVFKKSSDNGRIILAPYRRRYARVTTPIPTLLWNDGIDTHVSDYMRYLVLKEHHAQSSAEEYAKVLRIFVRFRRSLGLPWDRVDDDVLLGWQASMLGAEVEVERRNYCLTIVHGFYRWAEQTGRLRYHVCVARMTDYPSEMYGYQFPISSVEYKSRKGRGTVIRWRTPLTERLGNGGYRFRDTPDGEQILELFALAGQGGKHGTRNHLMMSWAVECGARLHELLQPTLEDLPTEDQIWNMSESDLWPVKVKRKGQKGKDGVLFISADLALRTYDYILHERKAIVDRCLATGRSPSNEVFISEKTGLALRSDSVTKICRKIFKAAKIGRANIHRLRASYITRQVERCLYAVEATGNSVDTTSSWHETILTMAAQLMGHTSVLSLRPYLNQLLVRRLQTKLSRADAGTGGAIEPEEIHRFSAENAELIRAVKLRMQGKFKEASEILLAQGAASKLHSENIIALAA